MTLEELERIAEARTKSRWYYQSFHGLKAIYAEEPTGCDENDEKTYTVCLMPNELGGYSCEWGSNPNAEFIAMAANNFDQLLAVAEAAEKTFSMIEHMHNVVANNCAYTLSSETIRFLYSNLNKALKALEEK